MRGIRRGREGCSPERGDVCPEPVRPRLARLPAGTPAGGLLRLPRAVGSHVLGCEQRSSFYARTCLSRYPKHRKHSAPRFTGSPKHHGPPRTMENRASQGFHPEPLPESSTVESQSLKPRGHGPQRLLAGSKGSRTTTPFLRETREATGPLHRFAQLLRSPVVSDRSQCPKTLIFQGLRKPATGDTSHEVFVKTHRTCHPGSEPHGTAGLG